MLPIFIVGGLVVLVLALTFRSELRAALGGRETVTKGIVAGTLCVILVAGSATIYQQFGAPQPAPAPPAPQPVAIDMRSVFVGDTAAADAAHAAGMFRELAALLKYDGESGRPLLTHDWRYEDGRFVFVHYYSRRVPTFGDKYPDFVPVVSTYLADQVGTESKPMTDGRRGEWIKAFGALAAACDEAS